MKEINQKVLEEEVFKKIDEKYTFVKMHSDAWKDFIPIIRYAITLTEKLVREECEERHAYIADNISKKMVEDTTKDMIEKVEGKMKTIIREEIKRCDEANAYTCWGLLEKWLKKLKEGLG